MPANPHHHLKLEVAEGVFNFGTVRINSKEYLIANYVLLREIFVPSTFIFLNYFTVAE